MKRVSWIKHNGKNILFADFSEMKDEEEVINVINELDSELSKNSNVLHLMDIKDSLGSPKVMEAYKNMISRVYQNIDRFAVVGVEGIKNVLVNSIKNMTGIDLKIFENYEKAKEYLSQE